MAKGSEGFPSGAIARLRLNPPKLIWTSDIPVQWALFCSMNTDPDPYGQAALMLCEGLLLLLVENGSVAKTDVLATIDGIVEIKREIAGELESVVVSMASIALLKTIARSLSVATETSGPSS